MNKLYKIAGIFLAALILIGAAYGPRIQIDLGKTEVLAQAGSANATRAYAYNFDGQKTINEANAASASSDRDWWIQSGALLKIQNGVGRTLEGNLAADDPWRKAYAVSAPVASDNGYHPQNLFRMIGQKNWHNFEQTLYVKVLGDNLFNPANSHEWNGVSVLGRYQDENNYYYLGIRMDGKVVIKKKKNGVFTTLGTKSFFSGMYDSVLNPDLIPKNKKMGLRARIVNNPDGSVSLQFYVDQNNNGSWKLAVQAVDNRDVLGSTGKGGVITDYMNVEFSDYSVSTIGAASGIANSTSTTTSPTTATSTSSAETDTSSATTTSGTTNTNTSAPTATTTATSSQPQTQTSGSSSYDSTIIAAKPVMYFTMATPGAGSESDKSGHGINGTYKGGIPSTATLPNGDKAALFNGSSQYLTVPSNSALSIPTSKKLTWEAWIKPDSWNFTNDSGDGYVDWMGKCQDYSPTCEWEARIYGNSTAEGRPNRLSAYVFNPGAGLGSAADWQPSSNLPTGKWIHVVAEYDMTATPSPCSSSYPGTINIWVNGVKQNFGAHAPTGCMSQYKIVPNANNSPLNIGTMSMDTWFKGAIGKVAVYNRLLSESEIASHFKAMTGSSPSGSCADKCTAQFP